MNRTKIEWCDYTLNPVVGCPHGCPYCYARRQAKRQLHRCKLCYDFTPHPHLERLDKLSPKQKPSIIFLDSMWDWNANGVKDEWIHTILGKMDECPQHLFPILSKRPSKYGRFSYPRNAWLGTSISTSDDRHRIHDLNKVKGDNLGFVSIEPLHEMIDYWFSKIDWIIVGAETGHRRDKVVPKKKWVEDIIENARDKRIPLFLKDNLKWRERIQEFPKKRFAPH